MQISSSSPDVMKNGVLRAFLPAGVSGLARHSYQPVMGIRERFPFARDRDAGDVVTLSARALISSGPLPSGAPSGPAFAHGGTKPQRINRTRRVGSSSGSVWRLTTVAMVEVGATL